MEIVKTGNSVHTGQYFKIKILSKLKVVPAPTSRSFTTAYKKDLLEIQRGNRVRDATNTEGTCSQFISNTTGKIEIFCPIKGSTRTFFYLEAIALKDLFQDAHCVASTS